MLKKPINGIYHLMDSVSQIKQTLNIVDVIGSYLELKKAGRNYKGLCPFHSEKTSSFMVSPELQLYKCFGCGESGDMFSFVQKVEGIEFVEALEKLGERAGVKVEKTSFDPKSKEKKTVYEINEVATKFYEHLLHNHPIGKDALKYLQKDRKLKIKTIKDFRIGFAPDSWELITTFLKKKGYSNSDLENAGIISSSKKGTIDKFRGRIMFPLTGIDGKVVGFTGRTTIDRDPKYLNTPETVVFHKSAYLYGLHTSKINLKKEGAIFVEGQMDVISAYQAEIKNTIATSGTALSTPQLKILARYTNDITFCFDSDSAGQAAIARSIELAEKLDFNMKVALIPSEYKDLDELLQKDVLKAKAVLEDAVSIYDFFLLSAIGRYDIKTAAGKKKIMQEILPKFTKIRSKVVLDHYIKEISKQLDLEKDLVRSMIENNDATDIKEDRKQMQTPVQQEKDLQTEEYMLRLLLNAKLDVAQKLLYKLGKDDFCNQQLQTIFTRLKEYALGRKRQIDTKYFLGKLEGDLGQIATRIYLKDIGTIANDEEKLEKEAVKVFERLKLAAIERELKDIKSRLKDAEKQKNKSEIEKLSNRVYKISKLKNQYKG